MCYSAQDVRWGKSIALDMFAIVEKGLAKVHAIITCIYRKIKTNVIMLRADSHR